MFYLINQDDQLYDETILVNTDNLQLILVVTPDDDDSRVTVEFHHYGNITRLGFDDDKLFNIADTLEKIAQIEPSTYRQKFITLTDQENIDYYDDEKDKAQKTSKLLVLLESFGIAFQTDGENYITVSDKTLCVQESPEQIYQLINDLIVDTVPDSKTQLKKQM